MNSCFGWVAVVVVAGAMLAVDSAAAGDTKGSRSTSTVRKFRFIYGATIQELPADTPVRIWLPLARESHEQRVEIESIEIPASYQLLSERNYGNPILYFEALPDANGEIAFEIRYRVERRELRVEQAESIWSGDEQRYLVATQLEPADGSLTERVFGADRPKGNIDQVARALYNAVNHRMKYDKPEGQPWGRGDARWACDSRFGNCTDFHSLFISLCRDRKIPAKFEIGFSLPAARSVERVGSIGGYHCWAKFVSEGRWVPVDISEANKDPGMTEYYFGNLTADRIAFTTGRDLQLEPPPASGPVNFLVYPYVEVQGKPYSKLTKSFGYQDLP
jgi:transglutaminase-like putative cysteine protease